MPSSPTAPPLDYLQQLSSLPLLQGLSQPLLLHLQKHAVPLQGKKRKLLFWKDEPANFIALVMQGTVHHTLDEPDGKEVIIDRSHCGELVGESALLQTGLRNSNALLSADARLLLLHQPHFSLLQQDPAFMSRVQAQLCQRLQRLSNFVETVCLYRLEARLARHLLEEMALKGQAGPDGIWLPMQFNQSILAAMLNASRPRLNAQLKEWQRSGLIQPLRRALQIKDPERLRRIAQQGGALP
ncbi:hypothetical protein BI347_03130 [Chromobacterium sphagni]|uniref:Cyclic nucleotide-binding domain-containing protein n=2 Tax=Chromobacterium sphagni TaxID=1903179 RepID=A0A1S1X5Y6_9NEIS|nr:hypothetical protein BI347_03130 [Chromobacterium sphagni]OHX22079.1 hypothetical protein BI344_01875 [Chromobacterium sphagni]